MRRRRWIEPEEAIKILMEGNRRFSEGKPLKKIFNEDLKKEFAKGQRPFAAILACSDSRVSPEIIFDCYLGDLFVVRVAGNIASEVVVGTMEYAVSHLSIPLICVLGHKNCGAINSALKEVYGKGKLSTIIRMLYPAILRARRSATKRDIKYVAVCENIFHTMRSFVRKSPVLREYVSDGSLWTVGMVYDVETGKVEILRKEVKG